MTKLEQLKKESDAAWYEYQRSTESVKPYFDRWDKSCSDLSREKMRQEILEETQRNGSKIIYENRRITT